MQNYRKAYVTSKSLEGFSVSWSNATYVFFVLALGHPIWVVLVANMFFMLAYTLLDPFTGRLGDRFGQRKVHILGSLFWGAGMFTYGLATTLPGFILAEVLAAIGRALASEALEAWLENSLPNESHEIRASGEKWLRLCGIPSGVMGGLVGSLLGFQYPWFIGAVASVIHAVVTWLLVKSLPESNYTSSGEKLPSVHESLQETRSNANLRYSVLFMVVTAFAFQPLNMYWTEVTRQASGGADWFQGFAWIGVALFLSWGADLTKRLRNVSKVHFIVILLSTVVFVVIAAIGAKISSVMVALGFFYLSEMPRGAIKNVMFTFSNKHIRGVNRSTMNSIRSAALPFGSFLGLGFFTLFSAVDSDPASAWLISSIILLLFACYTWLRKWE